MGKAVPAYQKGDSETHAGVGFRSSTQPTPILYLIPPIYLPTKVGTKHPTQGRSLAVIFRSIQRLICRMLDAKHYYGNAYLAITFFLESSLFRDTLS